MADALQEIVERTQRLIAVPSIADDKDSVKQIIDVIAFELRKVDGVRLHHLEEAGFPSLAVGFDERKAAGLVLNAHVDVVPGNPEQFRPEVRDGKIFGRGAQDMKGAAAVFIQLIKDLAAQGQKPSVMFQFVTDEEIGGEHGSKALLRAGYTGRMFIAGEPTDMHICHKAKGILWVVVKQRGVPAHGSRPWDGKNPIVMLQEGIARLLERYPIPSEPIWRTTATPSAIVGGDAQNRVPVSCELKLDIRYVPEEGAEAVVANVRAAFPDADVQVIQQGSALQTDEKEALISMVADAQKAVGGEEPRRYAEHFGSDARFHSEQGVPAICWGPVGSGLHSDEEWVSIESLGQYYAALRQLVGV